MERQFPKNVRQIGNVSDTPKIYVEDYVDTFLNQLCDKVEGDAPIGAFLIGQTVKQEDTECVYVSGAIQMKGLEVNGTELTMNDFSFTEVRQDKKEYFEEGEIVGWFLALPGQPLALNKNIRKLHEKHFNKENNLLIMREPVEKEEVYYAYKYRELMQMGGHYIYYEKNPSMQNYMIAQRKEIGVTPSEMVEDRAAKDFRSLVRERMESDSPNQSTKFTYAASTFLVLVVLVIGVTMINNYDKMKTVQSSLDYIQETVAKRDKQSESDKKANDVAQEVNKDDLQGEQTADAKTDSDAASDVLETNGTLGEQSGDVYIVQKGDTLASISRKLYGDTSHVQDICQKNGMTDKNLIHIGQKLLLP